MKFKNSTNNDKHFKLGDKWVSVKPQEEIDLPVCIIENDPEMICLEEPIEAEPIEAEPVEEEPVEEADEPVVEAEPVVSEKKIYSKEELFDLVKSEQIELLKSLNVSNKEIKKLKYENMRVDKILELQ